MTRYINRDSLALFLCLSLSIILYFSSQSPIVNSVKSEIAEFITFIKYPADWYEGLLSIKKENEILSQELLKQNLLNTELIKYQKENQELKKMLNFYNEQPWSLKVGKIVNDNFTYLMRSLIINLGKNDSIETNYPVLDVNGLVGKIIAVGDKASQVQLINDKNFIVSVRVGKDLVLGEFIPGHEGMGIIDGIYKTAEINVDDIVYTSGISTIYPEGIPVAKVIAVNKDTDKPFQEVIVKIAADLKNYNYLFVLYN